MAAYKTDNLLIQFLHIPNTEQNHMNNLCNWRTCKCRARVYITQWKEKTLTEKIRVFLCFTWSLTHDLFITCQSMHKLLNESQMYSHIKGQNMTHQTHKNCIPVHGWFRLLILPLQHSKASERDKFLFSYDCETMNLFWLWICQAVSRTPQKSAEVSHNGRCLG